MTGMWELTPHSCEYYHTVATFNGHETAATLHLKTPSSYTLTYGLDGEGRWNSLSGSTTTVPRSPLNRSTVNRSMLLAQQFSSQEFSSRIREQFPTTNRWEFISC